MFWRGPARPPHAPLRCAEEVSGWCTSVRSYACYAKGQCDSLTTSNKPLFPNCRKFDNRGWDKIALKKGFEDFVETYVMSICKRAHGVTSQPSWKSRVRSHLQNVRQAYTNKACKAAANQAEWVKLRWRLKKTHIQLRYVGLE